MTSPAAAADRRPLMTDDEDDYFDSNIAPYVAEFVGTFFLIFTVGVAGSVADPVWAPLAIGFMLMIMVYNFGHVSGAHLNPAVSFALALVGKTSWGTAISYTIVQILAGLCAGLSMYSFVSNDAVDTVNGEFRTLHVAFCEVIYTMLLCFVIMCSCTAKRSTFPSDGNHYGSLAAGLALAGAACVSSRISGRITFNPAASLGFEAGLHVNTDSGSWGLGFLLCCYELLGALLAAIFFRLVHPEDFKERLEYPEVLQYKPRLPALLMSEFVGTFVLAFTIVLSIVVNVPMAMLPGAAVYAALVYSLINVSGAHCNPAVTLAIVFSWRALLSPLLGFAYMLVQFAAAACAGLLAGCVHATGPGKEPTDFMWPMPGFGWWGAASAQGFFTMLLAFAMLTVATTEPSKHSNTAHSFTHGLAIGLVLLVGNIATGSISRGMFNPAVAFALGMDAALTKNYFYPCLYNTMFQFAGAAIAAVLELITHGHTMRKKQREGAGKLPEPLTELRTATPSY